MLLQTEPIYVTMRKYLGIDQRQGILNKRLEIVQELFQMLKGEQEARHGTRLEWIVIILIVVEVLVSGFSIVWSYLQSSVI